MKKLLVLILLLLATPAMADLMCKETEGCTSSDPANDCKALGYEAKTSLDKDCEHSLQCPFSADYAKCVKWKDKKLNPDEVCPALGYQERTKITSCSRYEYCPYDKSFKYAMCKDTNADCQSYGFVKGNLYKPGNSDKDSYRYIPYCWDHIECTDKTGTYYLCKRGEYLPFCTNNDNCGDEVYTYTVTSYNSDKKTFSSSLGFSPLYVEEAVNDGKCCDGCHRCIINAGTKEQNSLKNGNLILLSQLQKESRYPLIGFYCNTCGEGSGDKNYQCSPDGTTASEFCGGGSSSSSGSGGSSEDDASLCNCAPGDWLLQNGTCDKYNKDAKERPTGAVGKVYFTSTSQSCVRGKGDEDLCQSGDGTALNNICYVKAVALNSIKLASKSFNNCSGHEEQDGGYLIAANNEKSFRSSCASELGSNSSQAYCYVPSTVDEAQRKGVGSASELVLQVIKTNDGTKCSILDNTYNGTGSSYYPHFIVRTKNSPWDDKEEGAFIVN